MVSRRGDQSVDQMQAANTPLRLSYELSLKRSDARLEPHLPDGSRVAENQLKGLSARLHPLDRAIVREIVEGTTHGRLTDVQLARVLPLLAERSVIADGKPLNWDDRPLSPRLRVSASGFGGATLTLGLSGAGDDWIEVSDGRLVAANQAFFVRGGRAWPVSAPAPWELASWARNPTRELRLDLSPSERDQLAAELKRAGVPESDLLPLRVRRGPPDRMVVRMLPAAEPDTVRITMEADYGGERVMVTPSRPVTPYLVAAQPSALNGLVERHLVTEQEARTHVQQAGFRYDTAHACYVARGEDALRALDPTSELFPESWLIDRAAHAAQFRTDLSVDATARLVEAQGMLDVQVRFNAAGGPLRDDEMAKALIDMRELLAWLQSGNQYVRLRDGSYVAPSPRFRQSVRVLEDLGLQAGRATVSPLCVGLLRALGDTAAVSAADATTRAWLEELSGLKAPQHIEPPAELATVLREYQCRGLDWLAMLHRHRLTGILADDMGLGKTLQTLALLMWVRNAEGPRPSLVVAPTSVVTVWRDEASRFTPQLSVAVWHGAPEERRALAVNEYDLVVTSYGTLRRDVELLAGVSFRYAILDEAQSAKNAATQNAHAIRKLKSERRLALTGTPVENRPDELWSVFDFLAPGFLGTLKSFRRRYARPIEQGDEQALTLLRSRIQPLVLRRLKSEVAPELPPKVESTVRCEMGPAQRALYEHVSGELRDSVRRKIEQVGIERAHLDILAALTRLRQICCDPTLLPAPPGAKVPPSAKLELFGELMREALASERRVVVFSQFVEMQKRLIVVIRKLGVDPLWLHGGTRHRDKVVAAYQTPSGPPVIVVSLRAGGTGLTLTRADTVMHYDPWWNPAVERQATDRTHRLGQHHQVTVYKLVCARSIEERVLALAGHKEALAAGLLGSEGGTGAKRITPEEVLALFEP